MRNLYNFVKKISKFSFDQEFISSKFLLHLKSNKNHIILNLNINYVFHFKYIYVKFLPKK